MAEHPHPLDRWGIRYLFHLTHQENLAGIFADGLLPHQTAHGGRQPLDISNPEVNERRRKRVDGIHGEPLHGYVPLYFRARNPMISARRDLQDQIVVLYVDRNLLGEPRVVFTDGNAASDRTKFYSEIADLGRLDWDCLRADYWTVFEDGTRKRCAEVLVPDRIPPGRIQRAVVSNDRLRAALMDLECPWKVRVEPNYFF